MLTSSSHDRSVQIVSPFSHLSGHYWPYTLDLIRALTGITTDVHILIHTAQGRSIPEDIQKSNARWKSCAAWLRYLIPKSYRNRNWEGRLERLLRNFEFNSCLRSAIRASTKDSENSHIHCIESRHRILLRSVIKNKNHTFSTLCVGAPPLELNESRAKAYKAAFNTDRLKFIVETEAMRTAWEPYAGNNVIHIPAAIPNNTYRPIKQNEARLHLNLPENAFICLFFGTHREEKDYRTAIEAAKISRSKPYLLFAGPLISNNDPAKILMELNYPEATSWNSYFPDEKVGELFDASDAVILPYSSGYNKGSAVLLQACKYIKPVIATNTGHLANFVNKHHSGILFNSGDTQSLADCYDELNTISTLTSESMTRSIIKARKLYSWEKLIFSYTAIFRL